MTTLSHDDAERFATDGYLLVPQFVESRLIDDLLADMIGAVKGHLAHYALRASTASGLSALEHDLVALHRHDQQLYLATLRVFGKLKALYDLFLSPPIGDACRRLGVVAPMLHTHPLFHIICHRLRLDQGYNGFEAHQDWSGLQTSLNTVVVWIPLHDISLERFPLEVLPGSHRQGLCPGTMQNNDYQIADECHVGQPFKALEAKTGDVVFMSPFTVHRTGMSESPELRLAASWRYEDALEPSFIERRYPFAQSRAVRHELMFPGFPTAEQMARALRRTTSAE